MWDGRSGRERVRGGVEHCIEGQTVEVGGTRVDS